MSSENDDPPPPRSAWRLLVDARFGALFWGKLFSLAGVWIHSIVSAILVFQVTGSAALVGMVTVFQFVPQILFSAVAGKWADRGNAAAQMVVGRAVCGAGSGALAVWVWLLPGEAESLFAAGVLTASMVVGIGSVIGGPAMNSMIRSLVHENELKTAMTLNSAPMTLARVIGPALGALIASALGGAGAFAVAAAMHSVVALVLHTLAFPAPHGQVAGVDYSVRAARQYVARDRPLMRLLVACAAVGLGTEPSMTLATALADELAGEPAAVGVLSASFGMGAGTGLVAMALVNRRLPSRYASATGIWLLAAGWIGVAVSPSITAALIAFSVAGFGFSWAMSAISTLVQRRAPEHYRGRIMAFWSLGFLGSRPFAAVLLGGASDLFSVRWAFVLTAAVLTGVALYCRPGRLRGPAPGESAD